MSKRLRAPFVLVLPIASLVGCQSEVTAVPELLEPRTLETPQQALQRERSLRSLARAVVDTADAQATLRDLDDDVVGHAAFTRVSTGIRLDFWGFELDSGWHDVDIHQTGRCDRPDFASSGSHELGAIPPYAPRDLPYEERPRLRIDGYGIGELHYVLTNYEFAGSSDFALVGGDGVAVVIHPTAATEESGGDVHAYPIACGIVRD